MSLDLSICVGIGDILAIRTFMDGSLKYFDKVNLCLSPYIIKTYRNDPKYVEFISDFAEKVYTPPYHFHRQDKDYIILSVEVFRKLADQYNFIPRRVDLDSVLCQGQSLNLDEPYVVITTKVRGIHRDVFEKQIHHFRLALQGLASKFKVVILGERQVEPTFEYLHNSRIIYGIYNDVINVLPSNRVVDLTVPALGITVPDWSKLQQDCLIMKEAKAVITLGVGGNFNLATHISNVIGLRQAEDYHTCALMDRYNQTDFPTCFLTKDWQQFLHRIQQLQG